MSFTYEMITRLPGIDVLRFHSFPGYGWYEGIQHDQEPEYIIEEYEEDVDDLYEKFKDLNKDFYNQIYNKEYKIKHEIETKIDTWLAKHEGFYDTKKSNKTKKEIDDMEESIIKQLVNEYKTRFKNNYETSLDEFKTIKGVIDWLISHQGYLTWGGYLSSIGMMAGGLYFNYGAAYTWGKWAFNTLSYVSTIAGISSDIYKGKNPLTVMKKWGLEYTVFKFLTYLFGIAFLNNAQNTFPNNIPNQILPLGDGAVINQENNQVDRYIYNEIRDIINIADRGINFPRNFFNPAPYRNQANQNNEIVNVEPDIPNALEPYNINHALNWFRNYLMPPGNNNQYFNRDRFRRIFDQDERLMNDVNRRRLGYQADRRNALNEANRQAANNPHGPNIRPIRPHGLNNAAVNRRHGLIERVLERLNNNNQNNI